MWTFGGDGPGSTHVCESGNPSPGLRSSDELTVAELLEAPCGLSRLTIYRLVDLGHSGEILQSIWARIEDLRIAGSATTIGEFSGLQVETVSHGLLKWAIDDWSRLKFMRLEEYVMTELKLN